MNQAMSHSGSFSAPQSRKPVITIRRVDAGGVQDIWRRYGWVPPTECQKDFRSTLKTTAHLVPIIY